jgi:periplasmic protein TonB
VIAVSHEGLTDLRRWLLCAAVVILAHGAIAATMLTWHQAIEASEQSGAVLVEFSPLPAAPPAAPTELAPGPEQVMSDAAPELKSVTRERIEQEKIVSNPNEPPAPDKLQTSDPELTPKPSPTPKSQPVQQLEARAPAPATSAPRAIPERTAAIPIAPSPSSIIHGNSKAVTKWTTRIMELLDRNKRYPPAAHARGEHGVALVFFSLDQHGRITNSRIVRSSGAAELDEEALAILRRSQPFPPWPAGNFAGDQVNLTVPIRFNLR